LRKGLRHPEVTHFFPDFKVGQDMLHFLDDDVRFSDLTIETSGTGTIVSDGDGNSIFLEDISSSSITADDFIFG
jgi:hypothetical protein